MIFEDKFRDTNINEIKKFQQKFSIKLPKDYTEFLLKINGGILKKSDENKIGFDDLAYKITIDVLYGLNVMNRESDLNTWMMKYSEEILDDAVIIGDDLIQGFIIMICSGEYEGIYYWDDSYNFAESSDDENTYWLANNFTEFVMKLGFEL